MMTTRRLFAILLLLALPFSLGACQTTTCADCGEECTECAENGECACEAGEECEECANEEAGDGACACGEECACEAPCTCDAGE